MCSAPNTCPQNATSYGHSRLQTAEEILESRLHEPHVDLHICFLLFLRSKRFWKKFCTYQAYSHTHTKADFKRTFPFILFFSSALWEKRKKFLATTRSTFEVNRFSAPFLSELRDREFLHSRKMCLDSITISSLLLLQSFFFSTPLHPPSGLHLLLFYICTISNPMGRKEKGVPNSCSMNVLIMHRLVMSHFKDFSW